MGKATNLVASLAAASLLALLAATPALAAADSVTLSNNGTPIDITANDLIVGVGTSKMQDESKVTAPVYASGGCTTTPVIAGSPYAFTFTNGATSCSGSTLTLTLPTAGFAGLWVCTAHDTTAPTTTMVEQSAAASATSVVFTNYTRTTGVVLTWVASHVIIVHCVS